MPRPAAAPASATAPKAWRSAVNPLVAAAAPLLQLLARLRNTLNQPDPGDLRERAVRAMREFEQRVRDLGAAARAAAAGALRAVRQPRRRGAEHALGQHRRVGHPLAGLDLSPGGAQRRAVLRSARPDAAEPRPVPAGHRADVSVHVARLSGPLPAVAARPRRARPAARGDLCASSCASARRPSPTCRRTGRASSAPYRRCRATLPVWVAASVALAVLAALFVWFSTALNAASDDLFARMLAVPPAHMPQIARAAPVQAAAAATAAARHVDHAVRVARSPRSSRASSRCSAPRRRRSSASATAACSPPAAPPSSRASCRCSKRIGAALKDEQGPVEVIGYTDNQPIHTVQFPSNFQLSAARAEAASAILGTARRRSLAAHRRGPRRSRPARHATPRPRAGSRTGASRSSCTARADADDARCSRFLVSRWFMSFVGTALLAAAGLVLRAVPAGCSKTGASGSRIVLAMLALWAGINLLLDWRRAAPRRGAGRGRRPRPPPDPTGDRLGRGSGGAARQADDGAGAAEEGARHRGLSLRAAVVRDHRPARRRQDDGAAECRPALPARRRDGPGRGRRCRRHAAVRLVVHRGRRADRHRRPLHDAGFRRRGRPRRLGGLSRPAEAHPRRASR